MCFVDGGPCSGAQAFLDVHSFHAVGFLTPGSREFDAPGEAFP